MQQLNGFIKIHRKLTEWGWYQDYVVKDLFLHLLLIASFKDAEWHGIQLKKGQAIVGTQKLADDLGFTRQQIRRATKALKSTNEITTKTTNKYTLVTIVNWEKYQAVDDFVTNKTTTKRTNKEPTNNQQRTNKEPHRKNVKNNKNVKKERNMPPAASEDALSAEEKKLIYKELTE